MAIRISVDTSLLAHASLPDQLTDEAEAALIEIARGTNVGLASPAVLAEFPSLIRKKINQGVLSATAGNEVFEQFMSLELAMVEPTAELVWRSWEIATRLGQSDTFDAMGYAVAEAMDGEFWTCDQRFANAAEAADLPGVRLFA